MGRRGRLPDPNSKRSQAALARAKQIGAAAPKPAAKAESTQLDPPPSVAKVPAALGFWQRNAPTLIADGRLTSDRVDAFAICCRLHADIEQLADQVYTLAKINQSKYEALTRLYAGVAVMTAMLGGIIATIGAYRLWP